MKNRFDAIIFDLDGTLLDTLKDLVLSMNRALRQLGYPEHPVDIYRYFVGEGAAILAERALPPERRSPDEIERLKQIFLQDYGDHWQDHTGPYQGIPETLDQLRRISKAMGVLSNKPHDFTTMCVKNYFRPELFKAVWGENSQRPRKPDPKGALMMAELFGVEPAKTLYVGDTSIDMKTARSAGMYPLGVLWGFRDQEELLKSGAKTIASRPEEIIEFFQS